MGKKPLDEQRRLVSLRPLEWLRNRRPSSDECLYECHPQLERLPRRLTPPGRHSARDADQAVFPLAGAAHVHDAPLFVHRQMEAFVALDAVERQVIIAAAGDEVR